MDYILYGTFFLAQFGVPIAALAFIVCCIVKGEISKGYLKTAGFFLLWVAGGVLFTYTLCSLMSADGERAEKVCIALYLAMSILIYLLCKKSRKGRE